MISFLDPVNRKKKLNNNDKPIKHMSGKIYKTSCKNIYKSISKDYGEYEVMNILRDIINVCPNFCIAYGKVKDDIIMERVKGISMRKYFQSNPSPDKVFSCITQILLALHISHKKYHFTHYDLHTDNIIISECDKNIICVYKIDNKLYRIPTYGVIPIIIDYEFAYIDNDNNDIKINIRNIDAGFYKIVPSISRDLYVFLCNVIYDIICNKIDFIECDDDIDIDELDDEIECDIHYLNKLDKIEISYDSTPYLYTSFRSYILTIMTELDINIETGLREYHEKNDYPLCMYVMHCEIIDDITIKDTNKLFKLNFTDMIQEMLVLSDIKDNGRVSECSKYLKTIMIEFEKIQSQTNNKEVAFYMFKQLIYIIKGVKLKVLKKNNDKYIRYIQKEFFHKVNKKVNYLDLSNVKFKKLVISLLLFSRLLSYELKNHIDSMMRDDDGIKSPLKLFKIIQSKYSERYNYNKYSKIHLWDYDRNKHIGPIRVGKYMDKLNEDKYALWNIVQDL